jgi:hypothetical protein
MRQQTVERRYYHQERARATGIASGAEDFTTARAYARAYPSDAAGPWSGMLHDVGAKNAGDKS